MEKERVAAIDSWRGTALCLVSRNGRPGARFRQRAPEVKRDSGMTLLETLLALVFLTAMTLGLMQLATSALMAYGRIERQWKATVALWNEGRSFRAGASGQSSDYIAFPGARPIRRHLAVFPNGARWEILRAEK